MYLITEITFLQNVILSSTVFKLNNSDTKLRTLTYWKTHILHFQTHLIHMHTFSLSCTAQQLTARGT